MYGLYNGWKFDVGQREFDGAAKKKLSYYHIVIKALFEIILFKITEQIEVNEEVNRTHLITHKVCGDIMKKKDLKWFNYIIISLEFRTY